MNDTATIVKIIPELCAHFPVLDPDCLRQTWANSSQFVNLAKNTYAICKKKKRKEFLDCYGMVESSTNDPLRVLAFLLNVKVAYIDPKQDESNDSDGFSPPPVSRARPSNPVLQLAFVILLKKQQSRAAFKTLSTNTPVAKSVHFNLEQISYHSPISLASSNSVSSDVSDVVATYKSLDVVEVVRQVLDAWNGHMGDMFRYCTRGYTVEPTQLTKRSLFEHQPNVRIQLKELLQLAGLAKQSSERVRGKFGTDVMARTFYYAIDEFCISPFRTNVAELYKKFRAEPKSVRMIHLKFFAAEWGPRLQVLVDWVNTAEQHLVTGPRERRCGMQLLIDVISPVLCTASMSWQYGRAKEIASKMYICFHDLLKSWLLNGELNEFNKEFMIHCDYTVPVDQAWNRRFRISEAFVPGLLKLYPLLTEKILSIGKAMWFLKESNNQHLFSANWDEHCKLVSQIEPHFYYSSADLHTLTDILDRLEEMGNSVLLKDLMDKYNFADHIRALRSHFMLTNIDFAVRLYDEMRLVIAKPSFGFYDAKRALRNAVARSGSWKSFPFARCLELSSKETLSTKFSEATLAEVKLNFLYSPASEYPIIRVILSNSLERYNFTFQYLWNIFATRHTALNLTQDNKRILKESLYVVTDFSEGYTQLSTLSRTFSLGFLTMNTLTARLCFYTNEVVEKHSTAFAESLKEAMSLDGIIKEHCLYINGIYKDLCLAGSVLYPMIVAIMNTISEFCGVFSAFKKQYEEERSKREEIHDEEEEEDDGRGDETRIFECEEELARHDVSVQEISEKFMKESLELIQKFKAQLNDLGKMNHDLDEGNAQLIRLLIHSQH